MKTFELLLIILIPSLLSISAIVYCLYKKYKKKQEDSIIYNESEFTTESIHKLVNDMLINDT